MFKFSISKGIVYSYYIHCNGMFIRDYIYSDPVPSYKLIKEKFNDVWMTPEENKKWYQYVYHYWK